MKPVKKENILCYRQSDIKKALSKQDFNKFMGWLNGQTVIKDKKETYIYKQDFDKWKYGNREDID